MIRACVALALLVARALQRSDARPTASSHAHGNSHSRRSLIGRPFGSLVVAVVATAALLAAPAHGFVVPRGRLGPRVVTPPAPRYLRFGEPSTVSEAMDAFAAGRISEEEFESAVKAEEVRVKAETQAAEVERLRAEEEARVKAEAEALAEAEAARAKAEADAAEAEAARVKAEAKAAAVKAERVKAEAEAAEAKAKAKTKSKSKAKAVKAAEGASRPSSPSSLSSSASTPKEPEVVVASSGAQRTVTALTALVNSVFPQPDPDPIIRQKAKLTPREVRDGLEFDFKNEYLWSGQITDELYDENCVYTDPTLSFKGLDTFKTNIANLDPILERYVPPNQRRVELYACELKESANRVEASWRMVGDLALPWSPRIDLKGKTRFTYDPAREGRIVSYDETWAIDAATALRQIVTPRWGKEGEEGDVGKEGNQEKGKAVGKSGAVGAKGQKAKEVMEAEYWPGRKEGAAPPPPPARACIRDAPPVVILPGFGNDKVDYVAPLGQPEEVGLVAALSRRGFDDVSIVDVSRSNWINVARGLFDIDFIKDNATATGPSFNWYLVKTRAAVEAAVERADGGKVVLMGHSAGGWLARAVMLDEEWAEQHVRGLVTLGAPHQPPPDGFPDMTRGVLRNLKLASPGAPLDGNGIFAMTVAGDAITGDKAGDRQSAEALAFNSYEMVCGEGAVTGDGIVPLQAAHLDDKRVLRLTLDGVFHSINDAGQTTPCDSWYGCEGVVDQWLPTLVSQIQRQRSSEGTPLDKVSNALSSLFER